MISKRKQKPKRKKASSKTAPQRPRKKKSVPKSSRKIRARTRTGAKKTSTKRVARRNAAPKTAAPKKVAPKRGARAKADAGRASVEKKKPEQNQPRRTPLRAKQPEQARATPQRKTVPERQPQPERRREPERKRELEEQAQSKQPYYVTTAIAYPNGEPHIGHAYEAIATDAIARFMRLNGRDVFFLTGTDEHGIKMVQTAARENITPRELIERTVPRFQAMVKMLNCSNDEFIRTTEPRHHVSSEALWERMQANGDIYLDKYAGWYSVRDEAYYDESETRIDDKGQRVGLQGTPVEWVEEESYFFRLSAYQDKLLALYASDPNYVLPKERLNEVTSFVRGGLQDLSISRTTFDWGVKVPADPRHVMYVWVDALTNYITAAGFPNTDSEKFRRYWPANLHVIGKDIVRFHAVYWPAFLMSAGVAVPRRIFSHGFLFNRGEKMSKSVGNVIDPFALAKAYGVDPLRYFFLREVPFGQDGNYSHEAIVNRINADLANDLGNLAQRSLTMVTRNFSGVLPEPGALSANDEAILAAADAMIGKARDAMATQQLHQVLNAVWAVVAEANRYFAGEAPWALAKTDPERQGTILYVTAEVLRQIAILALPFTPASADRLLDLLAVPAGERDFSFLGGHHRIAASLELPAPAPVFPRYVEAEAGVGQ
jgi:methionyl-tRNA synthetase